jgi:uncharacterized protein (TIGR02271 family)
MPRYNQQLYEGMHVYDVNDQKIGTVEEILDAASGGTSRSGGGYLRVPTGFLGLGHEHHIPFSAIRSVDGDRIYVNFAMERLDELGYGEAPTHVNRVTGKTDRTTAESPRVLELREEELVARKQSVESGRVRVAKEVVSQERTLEVPVTREEVYVERHPVDRRPSDQPIEAEQRRIEVPVREERVELEKQPVVYEEVSVGKRDVETTQRVSGTVRREEARIEGDASVTGGAWDQARADYQRRWQERYGSTGGRWENVEPAYRYGYEMRDRPEYRGRTWNDVEPDFQRSWKQRNPNTPWERVKEFVRDTWEDARGR